MRRSNTTGHPFFSLFIKAQIGTALCLALLTGCLPGSKAPHLVEQYTLEYPAPARSASEPFMGTVRVDRFAVAQIFNGTTMIYRPGPYRTSVYGYSRWRVNPGDFVTDFLVRDLRASGMFLGVFSYRDSESPRFVIQGGIEEFLEVDEGGAGRAVLGMSVTFLDNKEMDITKRLVFQKNYKVTEPLEKQSSAALARGMSTALGKVSEQVLKDIARSIERLGPK